MSGLGGESNNIEESTITSLFASGYETKPALSVPIHVVELTNVPPELRMTANVPPPPQQTVQNIPTVERKKGGWVSEHSEDTDEVQHGFSFEHVHGAQFLPKVL